MDKVCSFIILAVTALILVLLFADYSGWGTAVFNKLKVFTIGSSEGVDPDKFKFIFKLNLVFTFNSLFGYWAYYGRMINFLELFDLKNRLPERFIKGLNKEKSFKTTVIWLENICSAFLEMLCLFFVSRWIILIPFAFKILATLTIFVCACIFLILISLTFLSIELLSALSE